MSHIMKKPKCKNIFSWALGLIASLVLCLTPTGATATETLQAVKNIQSEVFQALANEQFAKINAMADNLSESRERLPDGRWKLSFVTHGLTGDIPKRDASAWGARLQLMDRWIAATPGNPTPYIAKAQVLLAYAWDARGNGYANTVKEEDWPIFRQRIAQARDTLEKSEKISKRSPLWYEKMQDIAKAQSWPEEDFVRLFREGAAKEPANYILYFKAADYLLPRWHGSARQLADFVNSAVAATEKKEGQTLYTRIYWSLLWALEDRTFSPGYADWPRMRQGFEDIVRVYPDNWNLNAYTYYACMAQDWQTARIIGAKLTTVAMELWKDPQIYKRCMQEPSSGRQKSAAHIQQPASHPR
jgi:hypothetical protein